MANLNSAGYKNPPNEFRRGECTWYVYGRVYETNDGLELKYTCPCGAGVWLDKVETGSASYGKDVDLYANSIAVFPGHVVYIEDVDDTNVTFSGANDDTYTNGAKITKTIADFRKKYGGLKGIIKL